MKAEKATSEPASTAAPRPPSAPRRRPASGWQNPSHPAPAPGCGHPARGAGRAGSTLCPACRPATTSTEASPSGEVEKPSRARPTWQTTTPTRTKPARSGRCGPRRASGPAARHKQSTGLFASGLGLPHRLGSTRRPKNAVAARRNAKGGNPLDGQRLLCQHMRRLDLVGPFPPVSAGWQALYRSVPGLELTLHAA